MDLIVGEILKLRGVAVKNDQSNCTNTFGFFHVTLEGPLGRNIYVLVVCIL